MAEFRIRITAWDASYPCECVASATVDTPVKKWPLMIWGYEVCKECMNTRIQPIPYGELKGVREQDLYWYDGEGLKRL